jgi:predicted permease
MFRRKQTLRELEQDIAEHLEREAEDNIGRGVSPEEARHAARRKFGNVSRVMEDTREVWIASWRDALFQDLRFAFRMLRKNPGFAIIAILTLALGIGANTAIFSVVYSVLLKPLPFPEADRLVFVFDRLGQQSGAETGISYPNLQSLREHNSVFAAMAGAQQHQLTLVGYDDPLEVDTAVVTSDFFSVFQQQPIAGRLFLSDDSKVGAPATVIISENLWRSVLHSDPAILGKALNLDKQEYTVIGILPASFHFPKIKPANQIWIPVAQDPLFGPFMKFRGGHWLPVSARLKPGVSLAQAQAEMDALSEELVRELPAENTGWFVRVRSLQQVLVGDVRAALLVLLGAVGLVLLIACANIANLLLSRATFRARETAVRSALGAGRARIIRQLLSETAVLGLFGAVAGISLGWWGVRALSALLPESFPRLNAIHVDYFVLGFALLLSALASIAFGLAPAFLVAGSNPNASLREGGSRSGQSSAGRRARDVFAAAEIAIAVVLLVGAGLLLRSFSKLTAVKPGFDADHVLQALVSLPRFQYTTPQQWNSFCNELLTRVQAQPGLQNSALVAPTPISEGFINLGFDIVGDPVSSANTSRDADYVTISSGYFQVMAIPLLAGRTFDERDAPSRPPVTIISSALARQYFPNQNPLGKQIIFANAPYPSVPHEIIGVVGDVRDVNLGDDPKPMMYASMAQEPMPGALVVSRTNLDAANATAAIRQQVAAIDKDLPVTDVFTMPEVLSSSVAQPRFRTLLLALFAVMALVLAAIGIFGVISYSVSRRTQEIGIRMALGASGGAILKLVSQEMFALIAVGLGIGIPAALAAARLLGHLLFGVSANDPLTLAGVSVALVAVAALAAYIPMRRATRVDPLIALRHE